MNIPVKGSPTGHRPPFRKAWTFLAVAGWAMLVPPPGRATPPEGAPALGSSAAPGRASTAPPAPALPSRSGFRIPRIFVFTAVVAACFNPGLGGAAPGLLALSEPPSQGMCQGPAWHLAQIPERLPEPGPCPGQAGPPLGEAPPAAEPVVVVALYHPATTGEARHFGYEVAKTGVKSIQVLGDGPDLSRLALDGEVFLAAHGVPGQLSDGRTPIPVATVLAALTDDRLGLPKGFHGKLTIVACHAGEAPVPARPSLDTLERYLKLGGVSEPGARGIVEAVLDQRTVTPERVQEVRSRVREDAIAHPSPERRSEDQIMTVFNRIVEALELDRGSVVRQIAAGLTAAGYAGIEVTGPMGQAMAFMTQAGIVLEVAPPGADSAALLDLVRDLADFHLGSGRAQATTRLLAMGVDPKAYGAGRRPAEPTRKRVGGRPGADLVAHATRWVEDYGSLTGFAHSVLSTLDCTPMIGQAKAFLPKEERLAKIVVGTAVGNPAPTDDTL